MDVITVRTLIRLLINRPEPSSGNQVRVYRLMKKFKSIDKIIDGTLDQVDFDAKLQCLNGRCQLHSLCLPQVVFPQPT